MCVCAHAFFAGEVGVLKKKLRTPSIFLSMLEHANENSTTQGKMCIKFPQICRVLNDGHWGVLVMEKSGAPVVFSTQFCVLLVQNQRAKHATQAKFLKKNDIGVLFIFIKKIYNFFN